MDGHIEPSFVPVAGIMPTPFDSQGTLTALCTACGTDNQENAVICQKCSVSLAPAPCESLMQSIGQIRQKDAKKAREKAAAGGMRRRSDGVLSSKQFRF